MARSTRDPEQLVREYLDVWNDREYAKIPDLVSESFVLDDPAVPEEVRGPDGLEGWLREIVSAFPDFEVTPIDVLAGEEVVMVESTYTLTHEGEFDDVPPTGREVEMRAMEKLRVEDGYVQEHRLYYDQREFLAQLGLAEE